MSPVALKGSVDCVTILLTSYWSVFPPCTQAEEKTQKDEGKIKVI